MNIPIENGTMLVQEGVILPPVLASDCHSCGEGWRTFGSLSAFALSRKTREVGWNLFFLAGEMRTLIPAWSRLLGRQRAVRRLLARVRRRNFNCMELCRIEARRFLGFPYLVVIAYAYHLQESYFLQSDNVRSTLQRDADWARG